MDGQRRISTVAQILNDMDLDAATVVAIPLHDAIEDTGITRKDLEEEFGPKVAELVDSVARLKQLFPSADSMHGGKAGDQEMEYRRTVSWDFEDLGFRDLEPEKYREIAAQIDERWADREHYVARIKTHLQKVFAREGLKAEITGRPKHIYSIYCKMKRKNLPFSQIYDIRAIRIIVDTAPHCYQALNIIHDIFCAIPDEFDDYILYPKENHYRSLHTAVFDSEGKTLEVQIRTRNMHVESEYGAAAHWRYKEKQHRVPPLTTMHLTPPLGTAAAYDGSRLWMELSGRTTRQRNNR
jgi:(p)ppGpp synthase/HD superfamily hydrolase